MPCCISLPERILIESHLMFYTILHMILFSFQTKRKNHKEIKKHQLFYLFCKFLSSQTVLAIFIFPELIFLLSKKSLVWIINQGDVIRKFSRLVIAGERTRKTKYPWYKIGRYGNDVNLGGFSK